MRKPATAPETYTFSSQWENEAHVRVLVVRGCVDAGSAPYLSAGICTFGGENIVIDLCAVEAIDPGALRDVLLAARVVGIELHLVCVEGAPIHPAFGLALVGPVVLHESRTEAVAAASRTRGDVGPAVSRRAAPGRAG